MSKSGTTPQMLKDRPALPTELVYLWNLYVEIRNGCDNITYTDLNAYQNLMGYISAGEVEILIKLDILRRTNAH